MERRSSVLATALLVFVSSALSYYAGAVNLLPQALKPLTLMPPGLRQEAPAATGGLDVQRLQQVQDYIQRRFVEEVPTDKLMDGALKGMVEAVGDKYSSYFDAPQFKLVLEDLDSTFSGVGVHIEMSQKTGLLTVVSPIPGSPGERAGMRAGDAIIMVDGVDITKMTQEESVRRIRGQEGTKVRLTIRREGQEQFDLVITRAKIEIPVLEAKMVDPQAGIGYVRLFQFKKDSTAKLKAAMADLRKQGMTSMIFDLRQNPGGLLDEAIGVSSLFLPPKHPVVHIVYREGKKDTFESKAKAPFDLPLVVLVDGGSASASEIVAGAIKDTKVGTLLGTKTFGKGSVQSFFDLPNGAGVKLTTARYLTAGENSINGVGIEPHLVVENPNKVLPGAQGDHQLQEAIKHIKALNR